MKITLLGFMGSGKSSVARELSSLLSWPVIELDEEIVKRSSFGSIREIFDEKGESYFRDLETRTLKEVLSAQRGDAILSPGGGTFVRAENRAIYSEYQNTNDWTVFLQTPLKTIYERIGDSNERPLFQNDRELVETLYQERLKGYQELGTLIVPTQLFSISEIARIILSNTGLSSIGRFHNAFLPAVWSVIGSPIYHSRSPELHNLAIKSIKQDSGIELRAFVANRVEELKYFMSHFRATPHLRGLAVTLPHKESVCAYLDHIEPAAKTIGAVNTVLKVGDTLSGYNTDWLGIRDPLLARGSLKGKSVAIVGAGGTARAAIYAMQSEGAKVTILNRSLERMRTVRDDFGVKGWELHEVKDLYEFDVVIQTTAVGLSSKESLFQRDAFKRDTLVMDVVYTPPFTEFLKEANAAGCQIITGEEMFLAQAKAQFRLFHGVTRELRFEPAQ